VLPLCRTIAAEPGVTAELAVAAVYTREVRVGIDRIWENVLDWEHLPALHEIYFDAVALSKSAAGAGGSS